MQQKLMLHISHVLNYESECMVNLQTLNVYMYMYNCLETILLCVAQYYCVCVKDVVHWYTCSGK